MCVLFFCRYDLTGTGIDLAEKIREQEAQGVLRGMSKEMESSSRLGFVIGSKCNC